MLTDQQIDQLSDEELDSLIAQEEQVMNSQQAAFDEIDKKDAHDEMRQNIFDSNTLGMAAGAIQGTTFGFADEIGAAAVATGETISSTIDGVEKQGIAGFANALSTWKDNYNKNHEAIKENFQKLEEENPIAFQVGDISGSIVSGLLTGGTSLGVKASGSIVGRLSMLAGEGFMHGAGRSQSETLGGRIAGGIEGAKEGAIFGAAGEVGMAAIRGAGKTVGKLGANRLVDYFSDSLTSFNKKIKGEHTEWASRMVKYTDEAGKPILTSGQTPQEALEAVTKGTREAGSEIGAVLSKIDEADILGPEKTQEMFNILNKRVIDKVADEGAGSFTRKARKKLQNNLREELNNDFFIQTTDGKTLKLPDGSEVPNRIIKTMKLSDLNTYKQQLSDEITELKLGQSKGSQKAHHLTRMRDEIHKFINDEVKTASGKIDENLFKDFRNASDKYKDLVNTGKLLDHKLSNSQGKDLATTIFKNTASRMLVGAAGGYALSGFELSPTAIAIGGLTALAGSPRTNKAAGLGLTKLANAIKSNPDKYSRLAGQILMSADVSGDAFYQTVLQAGAEVDLKEEPLARTTEEFVRRQASIMSIVEREDPDVASVMRQAIEEGSPEGIAVLMQQIPGINKYLEPGIGWDGKAVSKEDIAQVEGYIKTLKPRDRREATLQFQSDKMIPVNMFTGEKPKEQVFIRQKAKDKVRKPEF